QTGRRVLPEYWNHACYQQVLTRWGVSSPVVPAGTMFLRSTRRGGAMILHCNYEELHALAAGAELILDPFSVGTGGVAAPMQAVSQVAMLQPRLTESLSITTLEEQRRVRHAVDAICTVLHERMDEKVLEYHPAHEEA